MKVTLILFAIVLVFGAQAQNQEESNPETIALVNTIRETQKKITEAVEKVIKEFKATVDIAVNKAYQIGRELKEKAKDFVDNTLVGVINFITELQNRFDELYKKAKNTDISRCKLIGKTILDIGSGAVDAMKGCVGNTVELATQYVENIINKSKSVPGDVTEFSNQARKCFEGRKETKPSDATEIIECIKEMGAAAYNKTSESMNDVSTHFSKLSELMSETSKNVSSSMPKCMVNNGINHLLNNSHIVFDEVQACVVNAIDSFTKQIKP
ncbi:uncharacterized protein LOC122861212 [Aphidius gifuensis]|uniref:uncharacterized protein LOC122861212 n=1 Tax=Aphidius gifuensis TaxID=684658 RepID=UPI001CDCDB28|nr:uncharacterized protein LOC122861212 [Aphidius gifuensis]